MGTPYLEQFGQKYRRQAAWGLWLATQVGSSPVGLGP